MELITKWNPRMACLQVVKLDAHGRFCQRLHTQVRISHTISIRLEDVCVNHNHTLLPFAQVSQLALAIPIKTEKPYGLLIRDRSSLAIQRNHVSAEALSTQATLEKSRSLLRFQHST
jgi:hypothetical protein